MCSLDWSSAPLRALTCLPVAVARPCHACRVRMQPLRTSATCGDWRHVAARGGTRLGMAARGGSVGVGAVSPCNDCGVESTKPSDFRAGCGWRESCSESAPRLGGHDA